MRDAHGAPAERGERAVVAIPSIRALYEEHRSRERAELLREISRGDRVCLTVRPLARA